MQQLRARERLIPAFAATLVLAAGCSCAASHTRLDDGGVPSDASDAADLADAASRDASDAAEPVDASDASDAAAPVDAALTCTTPPRSCAVPGEYATIQRAIDDPCCERIDVGFGEYDEALVIARDVVIAGEPLDRATIRSAHPALSAERQVIVRGPATVTLENLGFVAGATPCLSATDADVTLRNTWLGDCLLREEPLRGAGVHVSNGSLTLDGAVISAQMGDPDPTLAVASSLAEGTAIFAENADVAITGGSLSVIGFATAVDRADVNGGAIRVNGGSLSIRDCEIGTWIDVFGRDTAIRGGVIGAVDSPVEIDDCRFYPSQIRSVADSHLFEGGLVHVERSSLSLRATRITRLTLETLETSERVRFAGGLVFARDADVTIEDTSSSECRADLLAPDTEMHGGVAALRTGRLEVHDSALRLGTGRSTKDFSERETGADVDLEGSGDVIIRESYFNGIANPHFSLRGSGPASLIVENATIAGSTAPLVFVANPSARARFAFVTFSSWDVVPLAWVVAGSVEISNSVLATTTWGTESISCIAPDGAITFTGTMLADRTTTCGARSIPAVDLMLDGVGAPYFTFPPRPGSPVLDAIAREDCVGVDGTPLTTDQRGFLRPSGSGCDVGAHEVNP